MSRVRSSSYTIVLQIAFELLKWQPRLFFVAIFVGVLER